MCQGEVICLKVICETCKLLSKHHLVRMQQPDDTAKAQMQPVLERMGPTNNTNNNNNNNDNNDNNHHRHNNKYNNNVNTTTNNTNHTNNTYTSKTYKYIVYVCVYVCT